MDTGDCGSSSIAAGLEGDRDLCIIITYSSGKPRNKTTHRDVIFDVSEAVGPDMVVISARIQSIVEWIYIRHKPGAVYLLYSAIPLRKNFERASWTPPAAHTLRRKDVPCSEKH